MIKVISGFVNVDGENVPEVSVDYGLTGFSQVGYTEDSEKRIFECYAYPSVIQSISVDPKYPKVD